MLESRIFELHQKAHRAAFSWYIRKGFVPPILTNILAAARSVESFVKYNPDWMNQPRAPRGQPDGGQWTDGGGDNSHGGHEGDAGGDDRNHDSLVGQIGFILQNLLGIPAAHAEELDKPSRRPWFREDPGEIATLLNNGQPVTYRGQTVYGNGGKVLVAQGETLSTPKGISLSDNAAIGEKIRYFPSIFTPSGIFQDFLRIGQLKETRMIALFAPGQPMDYQRIYGTFNEATQEYEINKTYINFGNYNFGVVAAAAGYSRDQAQLAAAMVNVYTYPKGSLDKLFGYITTPDRNTHRLPSTAEIWDYVEKLGFLPDPERLTGPLYGNPRNIPWIDQGYSDYNSGLIRHPRN